MKMGGRSEKNAFLILPTSADRSFSSFVLESLSFAAESPPSPLLAILVEDEEEEEEEEEEEKKFFEKMAGKKGSCDTPRKYEVQFNHFFFFLSAFSPHEILGP